MEDGWAAYECFSNYLTQAWQYGMDGIIGLDLNTTLSVVEKLKQKPKAQLRLFVQVQNFAAGVLKYIFEQREQQRAK